MFTPKTPSHSHSLRPKRTRQATGNEDTLPTAKRKRRSALRRDTFEPLAEVSVNEVAARQEPEVNGHVDTTASKPVAAKPKELTFRGPKAERRPDRVQSAAVLATNDFYTVSELPSLPQQVRDFDRGGVSYTCTFSVEHGYALAITHNEVVIWPYNTSAPVPSPRDLIIVPLAFLQTSTADPLPLAAFTRNSVDNEPGLLVVSAKWGKIIYWDTLTNASTIVAGSESNGVQGSIPNMNGETVRDLINAEPAGFVVSLSRGRVSHISVRDQKGRPSIGIQNLNKAPTTGLMGTIGGSVRKLVGWSYRRGTPIVKAGNARKGQRDVLIMTENAEVELWETNITVGNNSKLQRSLLDDLRRALEPYVQVEKSIQHCNISILDVDLAQHGQEVSFNQESSWTSLVTLVALSDGDGQRLFIVELLASDAEVQVTAIHPIRCYAPKRSSNTGYRPRLSTVKSTAFAIFENAVVLYSLSKITESPSSQLMAEGHALPGPFQDVIQLDEDKAYQFLGHAVDGRGDDASCVLAVSMKGLIRIHSHKNDATVDAEDYSNKIGAKSRVEQAIFYGTNKENPLDLNTASATQFSQDEIEEAATQVSAEIITANSKYLPKNSTSITKHLQDRAKYLNSLIHYLVRYYPDKCSENLRDRLLWNAEKVATAQAIWKVQEAIQQHYPHEHREQSQMQFALQALHETKQKFADEEKGQNDVVRHFLLNDISNIDSFLVQVVDCLRELPEFDVTDPRDVGELTVEAVDLWTAAYSAVFKFREDNASWYGFGDRPMDRGVFVDGYSHDVGRPWTSDSMAYKYARKLLDYVCSFLEEWSDYSTDNAKSKKKKMPVSSRGEEHTAPPKSVSSDLIAKLPKEVDLLIRVTSEEVIWAANEKARKEGSHEAEAVLAIKAEKQPRIAAAVEQMAHFNMESAIEVAEHLKDSYLLVDLLTEHLRHLRAEALSRPELAAKNEKKIVDLQEHAETYYDTLGSGWALANFSRKTESGELGTLLGEAQEDKGKKQSYLNNFLNRAKKAGQPVGKISWINDIQGEGNYQRGNDGRGRYLAQKTQFCLAKLVGLAAAEERAMSENAIEATGEYDDKIALIEIQERLATHVDLIIGRAIDIKAAEELAMNDFSARIVAKSPGLKRLLRTAISAIVADQPLSPEEMVDFLTLADPHSYEQDPENDPEVFGQEFALAFKVVDLAGLPPAHDIALRQVIWRRAMIRDDWTELNKTANKSDHDVQHQMQLSTLFQTLLKVFYDAGQQEPTSLGEIKADGTLTPLHTELAAKLLSPNQILEENAFPVLLQERFQGAEKEVDAVKKDLEKEQATLKKYIEKAQLELHWTGLKDNARQAVVEEFERRTMTVVDDNAEQEAEVASEQVAPVAAPEIDMDVEQESMLAA
ncbi:Nucleoporin [Cyphellophora attinorum]|uniref:Nucleoporin n=1 Tax=Cyphellophora attinorum TaxID=1664694 RepID=A0A0N1H2P3_9EURO|nr:Nucleoporin [Phialophora attinorum]KPI38813.1 Nucleoporin [Phialophora attinorum]